MTNLDFQESCMPIISVPTRLQSFYGVILEQMPLLLNAGCTPMPPRQLLCDRIHGTNQHDRDLLRTNYVDTACALVTDDSGRVVVGLYSDDTVKRLIDSLNTKSDVRNGSLFVEPSDYEVIKKNGAFEIDSDVAQKLRENHYAEQGIREQFWRYIAESDLLFDDYLGLVQRETGGDMGDKMGLWLPPGVGLRLLCVGSLGGGSYAGGYGWLGGGGSRLVGVRSCAEGAETAEGGAPQKVQTYTMGDLEKAQQQLAALKVLVRPDATSSLEALLSKLPQQGL